MADSRKKPSDDSQDSWEDLAKDLFGVDFDQTAPSTDDLDDDLLEDDFLSETSDNPVESSTVESPAETDLDESSDDDTADDDEDDDEIFEESDDDLLEETDDDFDFEENDEPVEEASPVATDEFEQDPDDVETIDAEIDDFWDGLDKFALEELSSPHVERKQPGRGRPARDPKIGLISSAGQESPPEARTEFFEDSDFGVGILDDIETDEADDLDETSDNEDEAHSESETEAEKTEQKPRRRRSRRRRRGRKKPDTAQSEEQPTTESHSAVVPSADVTNDVADDVDDDDDDTELDMYFSRDDDDAEDDSDDARPAKQINIPSWAEAIALIVKPTGPKETSSSSSAVADEKKPRPRRSRGGRRRRGRGKKPSS